MLESLPVVYPFSRLIRYLGTYYVLQWRFIFVGFVSLVLTPDLMVCVRCGDL